MEKLVGEVGCLHNDSSNAVSRRSRVETKLHERGPGNSEDLVDARVVGSRILKQARRTLSLLHRHKAFGGKEAGRMIKRFLGRADVPYLSCKITRNGPGHLFGEG